MNEHPSRDIQGSLGSQLAGKRLVLGLTGSVAVVRSVELARRLMRQGAEVYPVMTPAAARLVGPDLLEWATGHRPILELSGKIEHVALAGNVPDPVDLILVAPATANTIGKIAAGIDDTPVTTFVTTGFGQGLPIVVVPAMHRSMYDHPFVRENLAKLQSWGIDVLMPRFEEGKAKIAEDDEIVSAVVSRLSRLQDWKTRTVLVTAGRTAEFLDPIRTVTNNSSGRMGVALAEAARDRGARVLLVAGKLSVPAPSGVEVIRAETADSMYEICRSLTIRERPDVFLAAAAVGDWKPDAVASAKVPTSGKWTLTLVPTKKIIDEVKSWSPKSFLCAFRAQSGLSDEELARDAQNRLEKAKADLIAANDTARPGVGFETETNAFLVWGPTGKVADLELAPKRVLADKLLDIIRERL